MKGLGESLAFLSVAVTLVALAALIIERVASRIGPRSGSWVAAAALTIVTALVPFAFCPVPASLPWQSSGSSGRSDPSGFHATPTAFAVPGTMSALERCKLRGVGSGLARGFLMAVFVTPTWCRPGLGDRFR